MTRKMLTIMIGAVGTITVAVCAYVHSRQHAIIDNMFDDDIVCDDESFEEDEFGRGDPLKSGGEQ